MGTNSFPEVKYRVLNNVNKKQKKKGKKLS